MKKSSIYSIILILVLVVAGVMWYNQSPARDANGNPNSDDSSPSVDATEITKVSGSILEYQNTELGFSVQYPKTWQAEDSNAGVTFIIPIDESQVSTLGTLQVAVQAMPGTCMFPPVTTVKDRGTITVGDKTYNTISMSNTVQGRSYFNRMYSLQQGSICYMFSFASIALSPSSKGLTGSNLTQAENNNKAIVNNADEAFTNMVKSFTFVSGPTGIDETKVTPPVTN